MNLSQLIDRKTLFELWNRIDSGVLLFNRINRLTPRMTYLLATLMLSAIGAVDYLTRVELTLSPFYAVPCLLVDWRIGRTPALIYGLSASYVQWLIGTFGGHPYTSDLHFYWDIVLNLIFYGVLIWIVAKLRVALELERVLTRTDFLTRLGNKTALLESLNIEIQRCRRYHHVLTVAMIGLDNFKSLIAAQGYSVGDWVLSAVADALVFRRTDVLARTGDAEFTLLLIETPPEGSAVKLKKVMGKLSNLMLLRGWPITFRVACAVFERPPQSLEAIQHEVQHLMDELKGSDKDRLAHRVWSTDELPQPAVPVVGASN
jgi:diguanylate cyclase (GGDEF)-like protein